MATTNRSYRDMTRAELEQRLKQESEALFNLRLRRKTQQIPNPLKMRVLRRELAQIRTVLNEDAKGIRTLAAGAQAKPQEKA
jgi:large subunit ribosomal protein L29